MKRYLLCLLALACALGSAPAQTRVENPNPNATISVVGADSVYPTVPGQLFSDGFAVRLVDPNGRPLQGLQVEFSVNMCCLTFGGEPAPTPPPAGTYGNFVASYIDAITDAQGVARSGRFTAGTVVGQYEIAAMVYVSFYPENQRVLVTFPGPSAYFEITQIFGLAEAVEYYNPDLDHYFITANGGEQQFVDFGVVGNWQRTGDAFPANGPSPICRFYGNTNVNPGTGVMFGPNSHFYTVDPAECTLLKGEYTPTAKSWKFESNDFGATPPVAGACPTYFQPVYRAYNNGFAKGIDSNHRITANKTAYDSQVAKGWIGEGVVMCAPQ